MSVFDKFLNAIRINDDDYDDDEEFYDEEEALEEEEDDFEEKPKKGLFSRFKRNKYDDDDDFDEEDDEDFDEKPVIKKEPAKPAAVRPSVVKTEPKPVVKPQSVVKPAAKPAAKPVAKESKYSSKVTPIRRDADTPKVFVVKPTSMEDTRLIVDTLSSTCTVVLNLEGVDIELGQRVIDFSSGACYALEGSLQKVSSYIFILTPDGVEISGDITDILGGSGISGSQEY